RKVLRPAKEGKRGRLCEIRETRSGARWRTSHPPQSPDSGRAKTSADRSARVFQGESSECLLVPKAPGKFDGLVLVKFPRPSLIRTATGDPVQAAVTTTSGKLSPFTSFDTRRNPPKGALTTMLCFNPVVSSKSIE